MASVLKPARYINNELNSYGKTPSNDHVNFCLAFPDVYEIGFSHLGIKILYTILNNEEDAVADRVYAPWPDFGELLIQNDIFKEQKNQYFKLLNSQKDSNNAFLAMCSFYLAIGEFNKLDVKKYRKNNSYDLKTSKKISNFRNRKSEKPKVHNKKEFLLDIWSEIQEKKIAGKSVRDIAEDLLYDFEFEVSHSYIGIIWKKVENV